MQPSNKPRTALVLSGGGTRGAYEAGVIHYIRTMLPPKLAEALRFHILCGSSVGAINIAFVAAHADQPIAQGTELLRLWKSIRISDIYRRGPITLSKLMFRTLVGVGSHLFGIRGLHEPSDSALHFQGFFDTQPFFHFLHQNCPFSNIAKNIETGFLDALAITATNMLSGQSEIFIQKCGGVEHSPRLKTRLMRISPRHVMASAALPLLFPPVPIHGIYYNDGSMRMNTPLAPAVSLGASRILLIGTRHRATTAEIDEQARTTTPHSPSLGEVLGKVFNAILLDRLDLDREQLDRLNRILVACQTHVSPEIYQTICSQAGVQQIETLAISPSISISTLVDATTRGSYRRLKTMGVFERVLLRLLETDPERGSDLLSYFLFEPTYLDKLLELGFEDARSSHDSLVDFAERSISEDSNKSP